MNATKQGFTLIEILVVITILAVLATVGINSYRVSQIKSRDIARKADLAQIQRALEMYFNDKNLYPVAPLPWGDSLTDPSHPATVYMEKVPKDPVGNPEYCYVTVGTSYRLYAKLENSQDPKIGSYTCGGKSYNYGVSSPNVGL